MLNWLIGFSLGAVLGSFCDLLANRSSTVWGRSYCMSCRQQLHWYDLFPIFSYLFLKGRCRYCQKTIAIEHLWVEIVMGVLGVLLVSTTNNPLQLVQGFFILVVAVAVFITDLKSGLILDRITYPAIIIAAILAPLTASNVLQSFLAGLVLPATFVALIIITKGKGMGWGDVKYVAFLGLALGLTHSVLAVFLAFVFGSLVAIGLLLLGKKRFGQTIPFGPFLSLGAIVALLLGDQILAWYKMMY